MKTTLLSTLALTAFLFAGLMPDKANAQKPQKKSEKITIRSSDGKPMEFENLHDTVIISKDGRDTTIIRTTQEGKEKKITVRKIITSGSDMDSMDWAEAETEIDGEHVFMNKSKDGSPRVIRIEKHINMGDGADSVEVKEIRHKEGKDDAIFDEPTGKRHKIVKIITRDGKENEIESEGDETTIIYLNDDLECPHHKMKKGDSKHHKVYVIKEEKSDKKEK
jgi:hypothetical protein